MIGKTTIAAAFAIAVLLAPTRSATAQPAQSELPLEQLLDAEVKGVSKAQERLLDAPASVTIISADEIRAFGFRTLSDILNLARGFYTYSDRSYALVGVRGFAPVGDYNTRVLLLVNGMPVNDNYYEQAALGTEAIIDLEVIERIEVIRGPSSSIYGTNAFLGVINVIIKGVARVDSAAHGWLGSGRERGAGATLAGRLGDEAGYFVRATRTTAAGLDVDLGIRPGYPQGQRVSGVDGSELTRVFARITAGNLDFDLGHSRREKHAGYGLYGSDIGDPRSLAREGQTFGNLRYARPWGDATELAMRVSAAAYRYGEVYPTFGEVLRAQIDGDWFGIEATLTHRFSSAHRLVAGLELRHDARMNLTGVNDSTGEVIVIPVHANRGALFAQSDIDWSSRWSTSLGVRYDHQASIEQVSPRGAVLFKPSRATSFKLIMGTAFRAPNSAEKFYASPPTYIGNPDLQAERIRTVDLEFESQIDEATHVAATAFRYRASDLITAVVDPLTEVSQYRNDALARARGVDVLIDRDLGPNLKLRVNGSLARSADASGARLSNSPNFTGRAGAIWRASSDWRVAAEAVHVGARFTDTLRFPSFTVANLSVSNAPRRNGLDVAFSIYNVFDRVYSQPWESGGIESDNGVGQLRRTWRVNARYAF